VPILAPTQIQDQSTSFARELAQIRAEYPNREPRESLGAVERLRRTLAPVPLPAIVVVGTNGKTSTATYLARMLTASGLRTGLYVSPHLEEWNERVRIDDLPCDPRELAETVRAVHETAKSSDVEFRDLRFFDTLTLAAELILTRAGASVAVFEAGIGGRLDTVRVLHPRLVLLTGVAVDHAEVLGGDPEQILREKLLVAPSGASVLSAPLGLELERRAEDLAAEAGIHLAWLEAGEVERLGLGSDLPGFLRAALALAAAGRRLATKLVPLGNGKRAAAPLAIDVRIPGRFERGRLEGVPYLLDASHNEAAWQNLVAELSRRPVAGRERAPVTALISVSPDKQRQGLPAVLESLPDLDEAIVTRHTPLPAVDPEVLAGELRGAGEREVTPCEDVAEACRLAFERARRSGGGVLVFGSTYLVGDVRRLLQE
jgi:dihydrofolate synthase / folylpolyglutamate synthase